MHVNPPRRHHRIATLAAFTVVSVGLHLSKMVVVPVLLVVFVVILSGPLYEFMKRQGVPAWVAGLLLTLAVLLALCVAFLVCGATLRGLDHLMPVYERKFADLEGAIALSVRDYPDLARRLAEALPTPSEVATALQKGAHTLVMHFWPAWLLVFLVQDAFAETESLPRAVRQVIPSGDRLVSNWRVSAAFVRQFMLVKSVQGLFKGLVVYVLLRLLGVDFPLVWASFSFLTTFLPSAIGGPLAMVGPIFLSLLGPGVFAAVVIVLAYPVIDFVCDEAFENPLDNSIKISDFQAGVATFYWALVLGPIGAFMALPLTVMVRGVFASFEETWPFAVLMTQDDDS